MPKTITRYLDVEILQAIQAYRDSVNDKYGPPSFEELGQLIGQAHGTQAMAKSALSLRCRKLIEEGYLIGLERKGLHTATLYLTDKGKELIDGYPQAADRHTTE